MIVTACALIMIAASVAITIFLGVKGRNLSSKWCKPN